MNSLSQRTLMIVAICILLPASSIALLSPISASSPVQAPPVQALKALYDNDEEFRATMDQAFANMQDPDPQRITTIMQSFRARSWSRVRMFPGRIGESRTLAPSLIVEDLGYGGLSPFVI